MKILARVAAALLAPVVFGLALAACSVGSTGLPCTPTEDCGTPTASVSPEAEANSVPFVPTLDAMPTAPEPTYGSEAAVAEPFPPVWALEQPDGSFACDRSGLVLGDHEVRGSDRMGHYRMVVNTYGETLTTVDFINGTSYAVGIIVGGKQFAEIPASPRTVASGTLLVQRANFSRYDQGIMICL